MNKAIAEFKKCCENYGPLVTKYTVFRIIREFGLDDFLENGLDGTEDSRTIAAKAIRYFCEDSDKTEKVFQFGVTVVCQYLHMSSSNGKGWFPQQIAIDLIAILIAPQFTDETLYEWIDSNFP